MLFLTQELSNLYLADMPAKGMVNYQCYLELNFCGNSFVDH